jgi:hypothetical protein
VASATQIGTALVAVGTATVGALDITSASRWCDSSGGGISVSELEEADQDLRVALRLTQMPVQLIVKLTADWGPGLPAALDQHHAHLPSAAIAQQPTQKVK